MSDVISKALLSGLGLASLTKDAVRQMSKDLSRRAKHSEHEGRRLMADLERKSTRAQKALHAQVETAVQKFVKTLHLATSEDLKRVASKVRPAPKKARPKRSRRVKGSSAG